LTFLLAGVQIRGVTKATISQAKMRLEALAEAALRGERVVITRGKKPAVVIVPAESATTQALRVSDAAADYLAQEARAELENGSAQIRELEDMAMLRAIQAGEKSRLSTRKKVFQRLVRTS
jgi:antitoxin (DNA-binding transcriptional repressor) of toxin-antitoxin stability system